jgi:hypothetical protein
MTENSLDRWCVSITDGSPPSAFAFDVQSVVAAPHPALSSEQDYLVS